MLPTVLAGQRGRFPCDRGCTHAVSSKKQDVDPQWQRQGKTKVEDQDQSRKEKQNSQTMRELSKNMQKS